MCSRPGASTLSGSNEADDTENGTGGGAATNSGIDYQQRVSAWFLTAMFTQIDIAPLLGLDGISIVERLSYETEDCVDDLKVTASNGSQLFLQIKRRLSLSSKANSDWVSTLDQFVRQYLQPRNVVIHLLLATSPESSSRITYTVKKLADSVRLNVNALTDNAWSRTERQVLADLRTVVGKLYQTHSGSVMTEADFAGWLRSTHVLVMDVESSRPHESVALTLLLPLLRVAPQLVWALLVKNSLHYAKSRLTIDNSGLAAILDQYRLTDRDGTQRADYPLDEQWRLALQSAGPICSGREYVLVESFIPKFDMLLLEFYRFDDSCQKRISFTSNSVIWGTEKEESKVLCRSATSEGMKRHLEVNSAKYESKSLGILAASPDVFASADSSHCATLHADLCDQLLRERQNPDNCIHCGRPLAQHIATMVEVDDKTQDPAVGAVHDECLRPVDRITGKMELPFFQDRSYLRRFDVRLWAKQLLVGQYAFNDRAQSSGLSGRVAIVGWNPANDLTRDFDYCVAVDLEDGSTWHMTSRGKLDRYPRHVAEERAAEWNRLIQIGLQEKNPHCYTSVKKRYGLYSTLLALKDPDEECLECRQASAVRYTEAIGRNYPRDVHFYAPLVSLVRPVDEARFTLGGHVVLLTSPLDLPRFLRNWAAAGVVIEDYEMRVVPTDVLFDAFMHETIGSGLRAVVDPILDKRAQLVCGDVIVDIETARMMIQSGE
jgi:hypothetical protein